MSCTEPPTPFRKPDVGSRTDDVAHVLAPPRSSVAFVPTDYDMRGSGSTLASTVFLPPARRPAVAPWGIRVLAAFLGWLHALALLPCSTAAQVPAEAPDWIPAAVRRSAAGGHADSQALLADMLLRGEAGQSKPVAARQWAGAASKGEAPLGRFLLGVLCRWGQGGDQDIPRARELFVSAFEGLSKAAAAGDARSQLALSRMYLRGYGVQQDSSIGAMWCTKAAEQGLAAAQCLLGEMHHQGEGVERDETLALAWTQRAAEQGLPEAGFRVGYLHLTGQGVSADAGRARHWLHRAADRGHLGARCALGRVCAESPGRDGDQAAAVKWFTDAAKQGHAAAQYNLACMLRQGRGGAVDLPGAAKWFREAAEGEVDTRTESSLGARLRGRELQEEIVALRRTAARKSIALALVYEDFGKSGRSVPQAIVSHKMSAIRLEAGCSVEEFADQLLDQGMPLPLLRRNIRRMLAVEQVLDQEVRRSVRVSDEDVEAFYGRYPERFRTTRQLRLEAIHLDARKRSPEEQKSVAAGIQRRLRIYGDFAREAARHSDVSGATGAWDLGWLDEREVRREFVEAVTDLRPGQISRTVETPEGLYILRLAGLQTPRIRPLDAPLRRQIEKELRKQREEAAYEALVTRLQRKWFRNRLLSDPVGSEP